MSNTFSRKRIEYVGPSSRDPLAFKFYNPDAKVGGETMRNQLRASAAAWHVFGPQSDPFGPGTAVRPWDDGTTGLTRARARIDGLFELVNALQIDYYCFHDRDVAPEGATLSETNDNLDVVVEHMKARQKDTGVKLLWGTANLFSNPRYMHGAGTSPYVGSFAYAAAQIKKALEVTKELGGLGYTFWGGREGYQTLWNTNMKRELDHLARLLHMAVDYAKKIGFTGQFYIEPKPKEPMKHQYDSDAAACLNFLRQYGLMDHLKLNLETNHATLAGHSIQHELEVAGSAGALGSVDANTGDLLLGWDTDHFPSSVYETAAIMYTVRKYGGFTTGGLNFDAKVRRESPKPDDLLHAHIMGLDAFALGLRVAVTLEEMPEFHEIIEERYSSWNSGIGTEIENGTHTLESLEHIVLSGGEVEPLPSGLEERLGSIMNHALVLAAKEC